MRERNRDERDQREERVEFEGKIGILYGLY